MVVKATVKPDPIEVPTLITGEELSQMSNLGRTELIKGELVQMSPTGFWHGFLENKFGVLLEAFVQKHKLGLVSVGEVGIYTGRNPDTVRAADVVFISHQRLAQMKSTAYLDVAPELVVEILSPGDSWQEVMDKLEEYFNIGVSVVWVADPRKQQVYVYHSLTEAQRFTGNETLSGGEVLPGFTVSVAELFAVE